jgi:hypothetical protein
MVYLLLNACGVALFPPLSFGMRRAKQQPTVCSFTPDPCDAKEGLARQGEAVLCLRCPLARKLEECRGRDQTRAVGLGSFEGSKRHFRRC